MNPIVCGRCGGNNGSLLQCPDCREYLCESCWPDRGCSICPVCRSKEKETEKMDPQYPIEPEIIERAKITTRDLEGLNVTETMFAFSLMKLIQGVGSEIKVAAGYENIKDEGALVRAKKVTSHLMAARIQLEDAVREFVTKEVKKPNA